MNLLAELLAVANTERSPVDAAGFYALKAELLRKNGEFRGHVMQEIVKPCWGDTGFSGCAGEDCIRCEGSGIYDRVYHRLQVWEWGGNRFLIPEGSTCIPPDRIDIRGHVEHEDYGLYAREARLWLYLLCGRWALLWKTLKGSRSCSFSLLPMVNLQKLVMELSMKFHRRQCRCGKWYFATSGKSFHLSCPRCRNDRNPETTAEIPF